jgi:hypothetical protein
VDFSRLLAAFSQMRVRWGEIVGGELASSAADATAIRPSTASGPNVAVRPSSP